MLRSAASSCSTLLARTTLLPAAAPAKGSSSASSSSTATSTPSASSSAESSSSSSSSGGTPASPSSEPPSGAAATAAAAAAAAPPPGPSKPLVVESSSSPTQLDKLPLPFLSTPLGVAVRPTSAKKTWAQRREEMVSQERRMEKRRAIVKQATRGYFHDFHAIRSHGGKTWRAPSTLIREDRALFFPDIAGSCLADRSKTHTSDLFPGKVSVVCLLNSKISEEHTKSFYEQTLRTYGDHPKFQLVMINIQENTLKAYLISLFLSSLRSQVPESLHRTYLLSDQSLELERDAMGYHNKHVGYTYLVAPDAKIRWAGCAFAEREEATALASCTGVLLERLAEKARKK
ncbi:related to ATP10 - F1F0 ATPase complex assembly protein [Pseudozyma flocculosa]|uniref:Related to ATP10 - F1F0 ATPase complex assembly protein n=1 Tax=Pseudozyma flocculosa TaxID=84751 RepID=A0A5C3F7Y5_9BASI|nr:related to ATP10 - F1F0 ATPase complex assembly protein [Pseudozyma flocculosa]